jgi:serine/threonine-protein kinase
MGVVVAAQHLQLGTEVAIKWLNDAMPTRAEAVARFAQEARAAARIRSEHVVRVTDVGSLDDGTPFMVMERLEGEDLAARLERTGPLRIEEAVGFVLQAAEGVREAHALGIVHRDLKPENLFCTERLNGESCVKVLDFGISKFASMRMTQADTIVGSPHYMSPEQMRSSTDVDARSDVWALGVVLHELIAGSVPFPGDTFPEVCLRVAQSPPASLLDSRPETPRGLQTVILRCLEKDRSKRFANVSQFATALAPFASRHADWGAGSTMVSARGHSTGTPVRPRPNLFMGVGFSGALALMCSGLVVLPASSPTSPGARSGRPMESLRPDMPEQALRAAPSIAEESAAQFVKFSVGMCPPAAGNLEGPASPFCTGPAAPATKSTSTPRPLPLRRPPAEGATSPARLTASLYDYRK